MSSSIRPTAEACNTSYDRKGMMFVLSSPSGGGKSTIARLLLQNDADIKLSVSCTTRRARPGEVEGKDYFYVSQDVFQERVRQQYFYEHAEVFGRHYGTPKEYVMQQTSQGKDVLFDIDWQGTRRLTEGARDEIVSVFILPPSLAELRRRLIARGQDDETTINARMDRAKEEISHWTEYDYVVVNDSLDASLQKVLYILRSERQKRERQHGVTALVDRLLEE